MLSANSTPTVYLVPDDDANHLQEYYSEICDWFIDVTEANVYHQNDILIYDEEDFKKWLNNFKFKNLNDVYHFI